MQRKIGIFGGTFNPIHIAHLRVAEEVLEFLELDRIFFVPSYRPPHKDIFSLTPFEHRYEMVRLAIEGHPFFEVSDIEAVLGGVSYTVRTLQHLRDILSAEIFFLMGSDSFLEIETWWHYQELFSLASVAVVVRPNYSLEKFASFVETRINEGYVFNGELARFEHPSLFPVYIIKVTSMDISASRIRRLVGEGRSIRFLVPEAVRNYIIKMGLYRQT